MTCPIIYDFGKGTPHFFLSNFYPAKIAIEKGHAVAGLEEEETYPSVEAAYQAAKTAVIEERKAFQRLDLEASMAKRMGQFVTMRKNWESVKVGVMASLLGIKFRDPELRARLLETSPKMLIEGVYYHDIFWGVCFCAKHRGEGLNNLGKLLMSLRHEIQSSGGIMR